MSDRRKQDPVVERVSVWSDRVRAVSRLVRDMTVLVTAVLAFVRLVIEVFVILF